MKLLVLLFMSLVPFVSPPDFFSKQLEYPRVAKAYASKGKVVDNLLHSKNVSTTDYDLFLRAFKKEQKLEVWAKNKTQSIFKRIKTYDFCTFSGILGPKRRTGDLQIPEGVYRVTNFNPESSYHLSFKIDYPNKSDLFFADKKTPGNDIYIHGDCVSIGCIPLGDDNIEELYLIAAKAKNAGGEIRVHIFPSHMNKTAYTELLEGHKDNPEMLSFWANLKPVYEAFQNSKKLPSIKVDSKGRYKLQ
jgi:murein L,D-transpeptidase YafK